MRSITPRAGAAREAKVSRTPPNPMTTPQQQPPEEPVPFSRLLIWGAIAVVLIIGIWLYVRYGREVAPLISA